MSFSFAFSHLFFSVVILHFFIFVHFQTVDFCIVTFSYQENNITIVVQNVVQISFLDVAQISFLNVAQILFLNVAQITFLDVAQISFLDVAQICHWMLHKYLIGCLSTKPQHIGHLHAVRGHKLKTWWTLKVIERYICIYFEWLLWYDYAMPCLLSIFTNSDNYQENIVQQSEYAIIATLL